MGLFRYLAEGENRRQVKKLREKAQEILSLSPKFEAMSDEELKNMTNVLKERYNELQKDEPKNKKRGRRHLQEDALDAILPEAFATVREAAFRTLNMRHFEVQLMGGIALHQGRVAEMKTGEGKTLTSSLPAYLNALAGKGVHVVTVNEYLAKRDAEWMGKIYRFLGLSVGVIIHDMSDESKREAYNCDITYGTNNEMGFDYLRDNLKTELKDMVQRELNFAIVDEVDSILIDEARTPLIISGKGQKSSDIYISADKFVRTLKEDEDFTVNIKDKTVQITEEGSKKAERFFHVDNLGDIENADLNHHIQQALKAHNLFKRDNDYIVNDGEIIIVDEFTGRLMIGRRYSEGLHQAIEAKEGVVIRNENRTYATITFQNYFRLYKKLSGMTGTAKTEEAEFKSIYSLDVITIPTNKDMIRKDYPDAVYSTVKGKERAVIEEIAEKHKTGQPILIGTITVEKSEELSKLLKGKGIRHNVLNAKNHEREAEIIAQAGRLGAVTIATNMAGRGTDILLGGNPEYLAKSKLRAKGIDGELIEAATSFVSDIGEEAEAVRQEYKALYNEFKEETDKEKKKVIEAGGLYIIGTERHESRRIDNQLRGRAGRQGDPGSSLFFVSLEDDLAKRFGGDRLKSAYNLFKIDEDTRIQSRFLSRQIENSQRIIEGKNFGIRKRVLEFDNVMNTQREVIYSERAKVLKGESVHDEILKLIPDFVEEVVYSAVSGDMNIEKWDVDALNKTLEDRLLKKGTEFVTEDKVSKWDNEYFMDELKKEVERQYEEKILRYKEQDIDYYDFERKVLLSMVDRKWIDHIDAMDQLRRGISLRAYSGSDPVIAYKNEGMDMFNDMTASIRTDTVAMLLKAEIERVKIKPESGKIIDANGQIRNTVKVGRNDPCPCGSGKKYKNCCGR